MSDAQKQLGNRISTARRATSLTQVELAAKIGLDRTAITRLENGERKVDSLELANIARALSRPVSWFLEEHVPSVISRRRSRENMETGADITLENLASDVNQLVDMGLLTPNEPPRIGRTIESPEDAEAAAVEIRHGLGNPNEPIIDLVEIAEKLGLFVFVLNLDHDVEGSYVSLPRCGVALIQGKNQVGRRRFTLVHELGHHVMQDEYSTEWITSGREEGERLINVFAIHFLLPGAAAISNWEKLDGDEDAWNAAVHLAARFGLSWSALIGHLLRLKLITEDQHRFFKRSSPGKAEFLERGLRISDEPMVPTIPMSFSSAVLKGYRRRILGRSRAIELMRGMLSSDDLPRRKELPLDSMISEFDSLELSDASS